MLHMGEQQPPASELHCASGTPSGSMHAKPALQLLT
jgi:hypothetical protein